MARVPLPIYVADPATGEAVAGAVVHITRRDGGADATLYAGETGAGTVANPTVTDAYGRALVWVDRHPLKLDYSGAGLAAWTEYRDPAPASDASVDAAWLAAGVGGGGGGGLAKVTAFPAAPADGDAVIRTDLNGSPIFTYSTENGWEQVPRMGAVTVPACRVYKSTPTAIANGANAFLAFDAERFDTDGLHDSAVNPTRLTVKTPGVYTIHASIALVAAAGGPVQVGIMLNGATWLVISNDLSSQQFGDVETVVRLAAGDYVELRVTNQSGAGITVDASAAAQQFQADMSMTWLGGPGQTVDERGVPAARVRSAAAFGIPNAVETAIPFDTEDVNTDGMHSAANTTRLTVKTPGLYQLTAELAWASAPGSSWQWFIKKNGAQYLAGSDGRGSAPPPVDSTASTLAMLAAGDYIELVAWQNSGGAVNAAAGANRMPSLSAVMVGSGKTVTPYARARKSADQAIPNTTTTAISWDLEDTDNDGVHDTATNNTRFVCRTGGVYVFDGRAFWASGGGAVRELELRITRAAGGTDSIYADTAPAGSFTQQLAAIIELAVGDYVELYAYQDSGGALNVRFNFSRASMVKVGAPNAPALIDPGIGAPNVQTASYGLVLDDAGKAVEMNAAGATVVTVPAEATAAFPVGTVIELVRMGAGAVTVAAAAGVTIRSVAGRLALANQYSAASLRKRAANEWVLVGDLA